MKQLRLLAVEARRALARTFDGLPFTLLIFAMLSYRLVHDHQEPWWLAVVLLVTAVGGGFLLGWLKARKRKH